MYFSNFYYLILNNNLLDYFYNNNLIINNFYFYPCYTFNAAGYSFCFYASNFYSLDCLNFNFLTSHLFLDNTSMGASTTFNSLWVFGNTYLFNNFYELNPYILNSSGMVRFDSSYRLNGHFFYNFESNFWLKYCFFFFENYDSFSFRLKHKSYTSIISPYLVFNHYRNNYINYFLDENGISLNKDINYFFLKFDNFNVPYRINLEIGENFKNLLENFKLFLYYKEYPYSISFNYLKCRGYIINNDLNVELGLKFSIYNDFIFKNFIIESYTKTYGSIYSKFLYSIVDKFFFERQDNYFFNLYNLNQFVYKGNRYSTFIPANTFLISNYNTSIVEQNALLFLSDTLNFKNMQLSLISDINFGYLNSVKLYELKI